MISVAARRYACSDRDHREGESGWQTGAVTAGTVRERSRVRKFLSLVMIEHSVFALPFAYIAALTAMWRDTRSVHWVQLLLITVAKVSARTVAMSANRILDRNFDALNPRTARRE